MVVVVRSNADRSKVFHHLQMLQIVIAVSSKADRAKVVHRLQMVVAARSNADRSKSSISSK